MKEPVNFYQFSKKDKNNWLYSKECFENISNNFDIRKSSLVSINDFSIITSKLNPIYFESWNVRINENAFNLCLVKYDITYSTAGPNGVCTHFDSHFYFFGHLFLKKDFGVGLIRPETLGDKIVELFESVEIDFDSHPKLSNKYYVLAENKEHFSNILNTDFLNLVQNVNGLQIEFRNNQCLFRLEKAVDKIESMNLCKIGIKFDELLNSN